MNAHDLKPGERITCSNCRAVYEATADGMINDRNDARCQVCSDIMVHWPQFVGLRLIPPSEEA